MNFYKLFYNSKDKDMKKAIDQARQQVFDSIDSYCVKKEKCSDNINVLYLDDDLQNIISFKANFRKDFNIYTATTAEQAELLLQSKDIHVLLVDNKMPNIEGVDFLIRTAENHPTVTRILVSAFLDEKLIRRAVNEAGVFKIFDKPFDMETTKKLYATIKEGYMEHLKLMIA